MKKFGKLVVKKNSYKYKKKDLGWLEKGQK